LPECMDCNGECYGNAVIDDCGICGGENYELYDCIDGSCTQDYWECTENICSSCDNYSSNYSSDCCDYKWYSEGSTCQDLVSGAFPINCEGCECPGDDFVCGDGICNINENYYLCPVDCSISCGNNMCEEDENIDNCFSDCYYCPNDCICGDGFCDIGETLNNSCENDCPDCYYSWIGDGDCDPANNYLHCSWDGGDCCPCTCQDAQYSCAQYGGGCSDCIIDGDASLTCPDECGEYEEEESFCSSCTNTAYDDFGSECCDSAWYEYGLNCAYMESALGWDCYGCTCPGDYFGCEDPLIPDCNTNDLCAFIDMVGDGFCDDSNDGEGGYNLTCYNNDGGDCESDTVLMSKIKRIPASIINSKPITFQRTFEEPKHIKELFTWFIQDNRDGECGISGPDVGCDGNCFTESWEDVCGEPCGDGSTCVIQGDITADGLINVLDVVALVDNILTDGEYNPTGDLIQDGTLNVNDVVALINIILGQG